MQYVGRAIWGIDGSILYASMAPIREAAPGATIIDVPCGGGVALRALDPGQEVRYIAADIEPKMLRRAERRARARSLSQVEVVAADMTELPFAAGEADLFLSFSGLHMLAEPERAVSEIARCLRPGGRLVGTSFYSDCSRRARALFGLGSLTGHPVPPHREDVRRWLAAAGFTEATIGPQPGFAAFAGTKSAD
ncbi:MAG TPA: class I SAM-dependent methyltransferase [Solirubrobacterales bacterium]|nr:class I SAM-dependent methyltransferase [Solirubrobacterales bacterium]